MKIKANKEHQTLRLFATLAVLTLVAVLLFRVVLFGPSNADKSREPAEVGSLLPDTK